MSTDTLHSVPDLSFNVFSFSLIALSTQDVPFFQSNPISTLFTSFFPPSSHCCIFSRFFFLVVISERNLLYNVWNYIWKYTVLSLLRLNRSITSARRRLSPTITPVTLTPITRTVWQLHLYDNYSETRTVINVFLFNFASELANSARLKELLRSSGLGRFYYPNHPVNIACGRKPE